MGAAGGTGKPTAQGTGFSAPGTFGNGEAGGVGLGLPPDDDGALGQTL